MKQLSDYERLSLSKLGNSIHAGYWSNDGLVQLIELCCIYLNPIPIQQYANERNKTYNGIKKTVPSVSILGHKYIIDND
ncbi:hypothetical protein LX69_01126 [Breznakibacter xylanolyticus]|uniref:Uncharacterized protein n=1 Tax=Breznakibacter xylanolyticus TaxID=990 RepID=A0A2W7Q8L4_9BACT|nr:hypothetical protein [Breznakibacter xylanolyticus]PZX18089.1 hypothetical protein LX69_01126 [Breznakibacter xylanolyticus]